MANPEPLQARDDSTLAKLAGAGNRDALEVLLERHLDRVHAICRRVVDDPDDALDATQEALIAVARAVDRFDGHAAFTTWLYRVATNAAIDERRRRGRRPVPDPGALERAELRGPVGASPSPGPESVADRLDVDAALTRIPAEFRDAVVLRDLLDLDYAQIADALGIPPGTVRSRIARGRAALAAELDPPGRGGNPDDPRDRPTGHRP